MLLSFPSLLTLCFQGWEEQPWLANHAHRWSSQLEAVLLPRLCQMPAAAAKLKDESQKHEYFCSTLVELGIRGSGPQAGLVPFLSLHRPWVLSWIKKPRTEVTSLTAASRLGGQVMAESHLGSTLGMGEVGAQRTEQDASGPIR